MFFNPSAYILAKSGRFAAGLASRMDFTFSTFMAGKLNLRLRLARLSAATAAAAGPHVSESATALSSSQNPSAFGQSVTFTATVTPAAVTGTVVFFDGGTLIGSAPVTAGSAAFSTTALIANAHVPHSITARYNGDATYKQSTSPAVLYTIT